MITIVAGASRGASAAQKTAIVPVIVAGAERPTLSSIYAAISAAVRFRPSIALVLEEESFQRALECGADEACIGAELGAAGVELGIVVVINTETAPALLGVKLLEAKSKKAIGESIARVDAAKISAELGARTEAVLERAGHRLAARVLLKLDPPSASVKIDGALAIAPGGSFVVAPGKHRLLIEHASHLTYETELDAVAGKETELTVALVKREESAGLPLWAWASIGVAVILAGVGVALALQGGDDRYMCAPFDNVNCDPR